MQTTPGLSTFEEIDRKCEVSRTARFALVERGRQQLRVRLQLPRRAAKRERLGRLAREVDCGAQRGGQGALEQMGTLEGGGHLGAGWVGSA